MFKNKILSHNYSNYSKSSKIVIFVLILKIFEKFEFFRIKIKNIENFKLNFEIFENITYKNDEIFGKIMKYHEIIKYLRNKNSYLSLFQLFDKLFIHINLFLFFVIFEIFVIYFVFFENIVIFYIKLINDFDNSIDVLAYNDHFFVNLRCEKIAN